MSAIADIARAYSPPADRISLNPPAVAARSGVRTSIADFTLAPIPVALLGLGLCSAVAPLAGAADTVSTVFPASTSHVAPIATDVSATLTAIATSGLSASTFVVHNSQSARTGANVTSGQGTATLTLHLFNDFHPGERVQATVTSGIQTSMGGVTRHVWQFRTGVTGGSGAFSLSSNSLGSSYSTGVSLGDVDGDGDLDVFVANWNSEPNRVWLNDGSGAFSDSGNSLGDSSSKAVSLGDVDGDGDLDAFVANYYEPNRVWLNGGSGTFSLSSNSLGSSSSTGVSLGDVDGDGDLDAFVANYNEPSRVWLNDGNGVFSDSGNSLGASSYSFGVSLGDVDGDGDLDAFVANYDEPNRVWLNGGSGTFTQSGNSLDNSSSTGVSLGDVDGDGDLDAFVVNYYELNQVWLNGGSGTFTQSGNSLDNSNSTGVSLGDVDGDGDLDAFVTRSQSEPNRVWLNGGDGADFGDAPAPLPTLFVDDGAHHTLVAGAPRLGATVVAEADGQPGANADGDDTDGSDDEDGVTFPSPIAAGQLAAIVNVDIQNAAGKLDAWVDFDGDGSFDLADEQIFTNHSLAIGSHSLTFSVPADAINGNTAARFRLSSAGSPAPRGGAADGEVEDHLLALTAPSGSGLFIQSSNSLGGSTSQSVSLGDVDGDGDLDAFVTNWSQANRVWLNGGSGTFSLSGNSLGSSSSTVVSLGDVDGDGDLDAFGAVDGDPGKPNRVWLNGGSGTFSLSGNSLGGSRSYGVSLGDVDGDGDLDAFVANRTEPNRVWLNDGSGAFSDSGNSLGSSSSMGVSLGDMDGDGDLDAFVANDSQPNRVWLNDGSGVFSDSGNSLGGSRSVGVSLGDVDGDGDLDAFVANDNSYYSAQPNLIWLNGGSGTFSLSGNSLGDSESNAVSLGDVDGDGDLDAFVANDSQPNRVWLNTPLDTDGDGIPDISDDDDDNDNAPDTSEATHSTDPLDELDYPMPFADVGNTDPAYRGSLVLYDAGIALGCDVTNFCANEIITRDAMARWLQKAISNLNDPPTGGTTPFTDVDTATFNYKWIEDYYMVGFTNGCNSGPTLYCPKSEINKSSAAKQILWASESSGYTPPVATSSPFSDVSLGDFNADWIIEVYNRGGVEGCDVGLPKKYCPKEAVTKGGFATMLAKIFGLW